MSREVFFYCLHLHVSYCLFYKILLFIEYFPKVVNTIYLTDYGLVLDKDFNLSKKELLFYNKNKYYD